MSLPRARATLAVAALSAALLGCGSSSSGPTTTMPTITTVATGTASFLVSPLAMALSAKDGKLYVADGGYTGCSPSCIRQVDTATGAVTAGAVAVGVGTISGITFDATADNLYYTDRQNRITRLTWSGSAYGTPAACNNPAAAGLQDPYHLVFDATLGLLAAESNGGAVAEIATCAGTSTATTLSTASIDQPRGIALGPSGEIYVGASGLDRILKVDRLTGAVTKYDSTHVHQPVGMQWLGGSSTYGGRLVVASYADSAVVAVNGASRKSFGTFAPQPIDVAVAADNATIFVLTTTSVAKAAGIYRVTGF